jgi:hypothetical protein
VNRHTVELVNALQAVNKQVPLVANALLTRAIPVVKQHEFAGLLTELGELLHSHADGQDTEARRVVGTIDTPSVPDWLVLEQRDDDAPPDP